MSRPFSFPPPPPPPPKRDVPSTVDQRGGFRGRGNFRGNFSRGDGHAVSGRGGAYNSQYSARGRGNFGPRSAAAAPKRDFSTAFTNQPQSRPKAPPSVPSFDVDIKKLLPPKPVTAKSDIVQRKSNLLGLTPAEYEESESEDDDDDEVRLASTSFAEGMQFEHKGQQLSLSTPGEIAAWIAERKKRYPTQAKSDAAKQAAEEKKKQWEQHKLAREEALRQRREAQQKERSERERQKLKEKAIAVQVAKAKSAVATTKQDAATNAKARAEKLRKKAERAAKELQELEKKLARPEDVTLAEKEQEANTVSDDHVSASDMSSSSESDDDDGTSSSGSSGLEDDMNSEPEEATSRRTAPDRVAPTSAKQPGSNENVPVCKNMLKLGKCKWGRKCRYSHKVQKEKPKQAIHPGRRKGLYQTLVDKEKEEQLQHALKVIVALGEQGLLDEPYTDDRSAQAPDDVRGS